MLGICLALKRQVMGSKKIVISCACLEKLSVRLYYITRMIHVFERLVIFHLRCYSYQ